MSVEHKNPADRSHFWERPARHDERAAAEVDRDFPRHVYNTEGAFLEVGDQAALDAALADGWSLEPITPSDDV